MNSSNFNQVDHLDHLFPPSDKFRIAVCLSGQPRNWRSCVSNIKKFFEFDTHHPHTRLPIVTDYFIHTWDINTWRYPKKGHENFHIEKHTDEADIRTAFSPVSMIQEKWDHPKFPRAWDSLFYSFSRSLLLKRDRELNTNIQYDMVVKARLDTIYNPRHQMSLDVLRPKTCYSTHINIFPLEFNYYNFDDVLFYGNSPTMDLMGDLYHTFKTLHSVEKVNKNRASTDIDVTMYYGPGALLYTHMMNTGIHPEKRHTFDYAVVRSTSVEKNLDGIINYDEIRQDWFDWYI
jgi:hypothetical protein